MLRVEDHARVLGHDKQGQPITLASFRAQIDAGFRSPMVGVSETGSPFNEETWGTTPEAIAGQQSLLSMVGGETLNLGEDEKVNEEG